jgi:hypothetical protein
MLREYFGQRMAAAVLALAALAAAGVFEAGKAHSIRNICRWTVSTAESLDKRYASAIPALTGGLITMGDRIADAGGADKAARADIRAWYAARYELLASKEARERLKPVADASAESKKRFDSFADYMVYRAMVAGLALLGAVIAFFVFNFDRKYKLLFLGNAGLAALLSGFFLAIVTWVFDWWPKGWFSYGDSLLTLLAGAGLLSALLYRARKAFTPGADVPAPGRLISNDFLKMTWLAAPVLYAPYFLILCFRVEEMFNIVVLANNPGPVMSVFFGYLIAAFLALPLRIKRAAGELGERGGS